jgi:hypothetical protein
MPSRFALTLYEVSAWIIPLIVAITFHEAAHGFVAHLFGDNTAWRQGRVASRRTPSLSGPTGNLRRL